MNTKQNLETKVGPLTTAAQFESLLTSAELIAEGKRNSWFYTGNYSLNRVEDGNAVLYFGGNVGNPILGNIKEASEQLISTGNYKPSQESIEEAVKSALVKVKIDDLKLKSASSNEWGYFVVDMKNNEAQKAFAKAVYGDDVYEGKTDVKLGTTRIYTLTLDYVKKQDTAVARACWLDSTDFNSFFSADNHGVYNRSSLRGVPVSAEGDATKLEYH